MGYSNRELAELLALESEAAQDPLRKALKRASRKAFQWPLEARDLRASGRSLTELEAVGPSIARLLERWFAHPVPVPPIPPLRADFLTMAEASTHLLDWEERLGGDLQLHTEWSDGSNTLEEMADAAIERGYRFLAITDHSQGLKIAGGLTPERLAEQGRQIDALNERRAPFRLLKSTEMNLSPLGEGDMPIESLEKLDIVHAAFHSKLRVKEDQTDRYLRALENPHVHILGHPRGRIYNFRMGLSADWERVFALAAELDKAVEVDGFPDRQDLNVELLKLAAIAGCRISLGTDAHAAWQLGFMPLALGAARKAGVSPYRILNFMETDDLLTWASDLSEKARR